MTTRQERINEFLRSEISEIIRREIKDPRVGFVTITEVKVTKDLRHADVYFSVMGDDEQKAASLRVLQRAAGFMRGLIGRHAHLKVIPELHFKLDTAMEHGARIFELLQQVKPHDEE
jgi:ribosome-binding factor A